MPRWLGQVPIRQNVVIKQVSCSEQAIAACVKTDAYMHVVRSLRQSRSTMSHPDKVCGPSVPG